MNYNIFDADGTILDSMFLWEKYEKKAKRKSGFTLDPALKEKMKTMAVIDACQLVIDRFHLPLRKEQLYKFYIRKMSRAYRKVKLKADVLDFLNYLKSQDATMVVFTASPKEVIAKALKKLGADEFFSRIYSSEELGSKKSLDAFRNVHIELEKLVGKEISKGDITMYEDSLEAVQKAKEYGFKVCAIADETTKDQREEMIQWADCFIDSYLELTKEDLKI